MPSTNTRRHLTISLSKLSRRKRKSFASGLAYILRAKFTCHRLGRTHNHTRKGGVRGWGMNGWAGSVESLARAAADAERRKDAVEGRELILALPHEFSSEDGLRMLAMMSAYLWKTFQVASVFALHEPDRLGDRRNRHGHVIFSSRRVNDSGTALGKKTREWDTQLGRKHLENLRAYWCQALNEHLEIVGEEGNLEHRSFARLGIEEEPGRHRGVAETAIERRGKKRALKLRPLPTPVPIAPLHPATSPGEKAGAIRLGHRMAGPSVLPLFEPPKPFVQPHPVGPAPNLGNDQPRQSTPSL